MVSYTAFLLSHETRQRLIDAIPPAYPEIKADHITHEFNVNDFGSLFHPQTIEITGIVDDGNGLQALIITVDGEQNKPDGRPYHITWSLNPEKRTPEWFGINERYRPIHSNILIEQALAGNVRIETITPPLKIEAAPSLIVKNDDGSRTIRNLPQPVHYSPPPSKPNL